MAWQERSQSGTQGREGYGGQTIRPGERRASSILVEPSEDYHIGPRDVLEISVEDAPELSGTVEVNSKGTIPMRYLKIVSVLGKTPEEVARHIADGLRGKYLKDPQVSVTVREHNSRIFFVQGSVRNPGVYQMEGRASLFKLITLAGGFQDNHGSMAYIIRRQDESEPAATATPPASDAPPAQETEAFQMTPVNIAGLENGHFDQNVLLKPGDLVVIPRTDLFFVSGEVVQPGEFALKPNTTIRQAITLARGFTFKAAKGRAIIFRDDRKTGERQQITVDIGAIMDGKKEDIQLMANDVLQVPSSRAKSIGGTLLNAFGMSTAMRGVPVR
jgi:polysaccharide export outer membrane protein